MLRAASKHLDEALRRTLEHAAKAPYYARVWQGAERAVKGCRDLDRLPFLDKPSAASVQEDLLVPGVAASPEFLEAGVVSSATTREGRPLRILRSPDEVPPGAGGSRERAPFRILSLYSPGHGVRGPEGDRVLLPATLHPNTVDVVHDLLSTKGERPFRYLVTPLSALKWLTVALVEKGIAPARYSLVGIGTTGHLLTRHSRRWLESTWRAPCFDNYSLSELLGYAAPCRLCSYCHWHGAPTWFELIDPMSGKRTTSKLGELVATTLVPGVLRMPLIRYRTGDVVEVGPRCRASETRGLRFRGRLAHSLVVEKGGSTRYLALSRDLQEVTEGLPDVALEPHPAELLGRVPVSELGVPKASVDKERGVVRVELRYVPERFGARADEVRRIIQDALVVNERQKERAPVELLPPGSVDIRREALKLT